MKFVDLNKIEELKEIFTPYILTALKEKYMETYQRKCLDEINEEYKKELVLVDNFRSYFIAGAISHYGYGKINGRRWKVWTYCVANFPKRYKFSSGMNYPNGYKEQEI